MITQKEGVLPSSGIRITHKGVFDINSIYSDVKDWFKNYRYEYAEKEYAIKEKANGKEIVIKMEAHRNIDDYARFVIQIVFDFEKAVKVNEGFRGEGKITFNAHVLLDYKNKWQNNKFNKFIFFIYNNYI